MYRLTGLNSVLGVSREKILGSHNTSIVKILINENQFYSKITTAYFIIKYYILQNALRLDNKDQNWDILSLHFWF